MSPIMESIMAKSKSKCVYPYPIMVIYFQGGEVVRMSFWQPVGRPWRFGPVVENIKQVIGNERARLGIGPCRTSGQTECWSGMGEAPYGEPATDVLSVHIEHQGEIIREAPALTRAENRQVRREARRIAA